MSLTEAARALHTSQPGVSKAIIDLEQELGIDIFTRHGKRLKSITEPGRHVLESIANSLGAISAGIDGVSTVEEVQEKPTLTDMVFNGKATARSAKDKNLVAINVRAAREAGLEYHRITDYDEACGLLIAENRRSTMSAALDVRYASSQG